MPEVKDTPTPEKVAHTPGPWFHAPLSDEVLNQKGHGVCAPCDGYDEDQWKADARLIAAAPELLDKLKTFVLFVEGLAESSFNNLEQEDPEMFTLLRSGIAAIVKAEVRPMEAQS